MKFFSLIASVVLGLTSVANATKDDIVDTAIAGGFDTLVTAVATADLVDTLRSDGPFTVFAPTDEAFANLGLGYLSFLLRPEGKQALTDILLYHVVAGKVLSKDLKDKSKVETVLGKDVFVQIKRFGIFAKIMGFFGLLIFADIEINDSQVIAVDIEASNGVIHAIDKVLEPFDFPDTIVDTAVGAGIFKSLAAALTFTDLIDPLVDPDSAFTVFAPTDDAFGKLPSNVLDFLFTSRGKDLLTDILLYHVVDGIVFFGDLEDGLKIETLFEDDTLKVDIDRRGAFLRDGQKQVIGFDATDVVASNGIIHIIDTVLLFKDIEDRF